jgi:hypothetical protein
MHRSDATSRPVAAITFGITAYDAELPKAAWKSLRWRLPIVATHFTLAALCKHQLNIPWRCSTTPGRSDPNQQLPDVPPKNFENTRAICRRRTQTSHDVSAPTAGSQGNADVTPEPIALQEKPFRARRKIAAKPCKQREVSL